MKLMMHIFAFLLIFCVIYITVINGGDTVTVNLTAPQYDAVTEISNQVSKNISMAFYTLSILGIGLIAGVCIFVPFYLTQTEQLFAYKRELEKNSIKTDNSSAQVKVLQAKIQVLEKALQEALK
jgi:hypothetical protein